MSFLAKLVLGSTEFNVLTADYEITQPTDAQNRPNGKPKGGIINLTLEASAKNDLAEWMMSPTMKKSGRLTFYRRDANSSMKTVSFSDGFCIYYHESFDANNKDPMKTIIRISAGEMKINNNCVLTNPWSSMSALAADIGDKLGLGSIVGGGGPGIMDDIMNDPDMKEMGSMAKSGYDTAKKGADTASAVKDDAQQLEHEAEEDAGDVSHEASEKKKDADNAISSFIP